ncbi:MAG: hypothetical protein A4E32_01176 [Methanomassiliicoccales archaeon PtaU1.Bin124]|nr:MAG: hypothetical protein A4E32_01176 [Methanomassiliicoccales archaeon PtaU1.Bin124]
MRGVFLTLYLIIALVVLQFIMVNYFSDLDVKEFQQLWFPLVVFLIMTYASYMFSVFFGGETAYRVSEAFSTLSLFVFLAFFIVGSPKVLNLNADAAAIPALLIGITLSADSMVRERRPTPSTVLQAAAIVAVGAVVSLFLLYYNYSLARSIAPLVAMTIVAVISLLALFEKHSNETVALLGKWMASLVHKVVLCIIALAISIYFFIVRPDWEGQAATNATMAEWIVLIVVAAVILFYTLRWLRKGSHRETMGDWGLLVQSVMRDRGDMKAVREAVDEFVVYGRKEPFLVQIVKTMQMNGVKDEQISEAIHRLVIYTTYTKDLYPIWTRGDVQRSYQKERTGVVIDVLQNAAKAMKADYLSHNIEETREKI